jgi:curved DNA-binding protein CbpA
MKRSSRTDPFTALELPSRADLSDDDVRSAWRRVAAATHPDRDDGGDPARFAEAAAAYTALRTRFGRGEALADLSATRRGHKQARVRSPLALGRAWQRVRNRLLAPRRVWARVRRPLALGRFGSRVRRGRPGRLALRILMAAAVSAGSVMVAGTRPATPALITGALTWLALTARHDLAPPDTNVQHMK